MEEDDQTKLCTNCQRQIPAANYMMHSIHCARNLKVCDKCKEPVPLSDMNKHTENVACKQCGERMQSCDVSAHQREACPQTCVTCSHCSLQLARALMRDHETYCGTRTERCDECGELVMIKYRKIHEDTNHGFLKLDDEPGPQPSWITPRPTTATSMTAFEPSVKPSKPAGVVQPAPKWSKAFAPDPKAKARPMALSSTSSQTRPMPSNGENASGSSQNPVRVTSFNVPAVSSVRPNNSSAIGNDNNKIINAFNELRQEQNRIANANGSARNEVRNGATSNSTVETPSSSVIVSAAQSSVVETANQPNNQLARSKGAIKKYPAPQPPNVKKSKDGSHKSNSIGQSKDSSMSPSFKHTRDVPMYAAMLREQEQKRQREEQTAINLAQGLPPVLNPAEKIEKLRKMSALQNLEVDRENHGQKPPKNASHNKPKNDLFKFTPMSEDELLKRLQKQNIDPNVKNQNQDDHYYEPVEAGVWDPPQNAAASSKPWPKVDNSRSQQVDRFSEIKNDLRVLRKELKECSSPLESRRMSSDPVTPQRPHRRPSNDERLSDNHILRDQNVQSPPSEPRNSSMWIPVTPKQPSREQASPIVEDPKNASMWIPVTPANKKTNSGKDPERKHSRKEEKKRNKARNRAESSDSGTELPCEFCNRMIPVADMVDHEVYCQLRAKNQQDLQNRLPNCSPNLSYSVANAAANNPPVRIRDVVNDNLLRAAANQDATYNRTVANENVMYNRLPANEDYQEFVNSFTPPDLADVMLPCEFCGQSVPAHLFVTHETGCNPLETSILPPSRISPEADENPFRGPIKDTNVQLSNTQRISQDDIRKAAKRNSNRRQHGNVKVPVQPVAARIESDSEGIRGYDAPDEVQIPCEFCMHLLPVEELMNHQEQCRG